jgi:hypothetical protein
MWINDKYGIKWENLFWSNYPNIIQYIVEGVYISWLFYDGASTAMTILGKRLEDSNYLFTFSLTTVPRTRIFLVQC